MTKVVGLRELARNTSILDQFDYIDIEDKKTHEYKGVFISAKYAKEFKEMLERKLSDENQKQVDAIMQFSGIANGALRDIDTKDDIKREYAKRFSE
ncbi:MAG: hypothetical protein FAF05_02320 [Epsilonproteobacteria bacterium]|nr:hypothetical protein [Campylobacterota bacterium]